MLIDTNIILEIIFEQERWRECSDLFKAVKNDLFNERTYITRFSLSAICAACKKRHQSFLRDLFLLIYQEKMEVFELDVRDDMMINALREDVGLDFDDTVQFLAAQKASTYIVTFDKDFAGKPVIAKTPKEVLDGVLLK